MLRALIRFYQLAISPMLGPRCRYYPSCSNYALQAIQLHGPLRGTALAGWRLLRCNPWSPGGVDFPPPRRGAEGADDPALHHGHEHGQGHGRGSVCAAAEVQPAAPAYDDETSDQGSVPDGSTDRRSTPQGV